MNKPQIALCFTGHRDLPNTVELSNLKQKLRTTIDQAISDGYTTFYFGGARGFDLLAGWHVAYAKKDHPTIRLVAVIPYEGQANRWSEADREEYFTLMPQCDEVITLSKHYHEDCFKVRNQYMVDHSSRILAYYHGNPRSGTGQTVQMAERKSLEIINLYG